MGYYLRRAHWGQGLATEAGQAVVRLATVSNRMCLAEGKEKPSIEVELLA